LLWIGLMSGTSADGIDAALVDLGESPRELALVHFCSSPFSDSLRERIHGALAGPVALRELLALDRELGERFAEAALALLRAAGIAPSAVAGIGSHGQTLAHYPDSEVAGSLQLGSAAEIHARTGIRVISDFRRADLAAGGQGAPLTPFLHHARFATDGERRAVLNIGGFTNVTYLPDSSADRLIAFDPGPGNALLDRAARWASAGREQFDEGGARARRGRVDEALLEELLSDPYFSLPPPKSTGHEHFGEAFFERARRGIEAAGGGADDLLATLADRLVAKGASIRIVTSDKDLAQVVREDGRIVTYDLARDELRDAAGVREKFGVDPDQIPDYLGLIGDSVDNLPGVPGVGPKSASAALRAFGRIEHISSDPLDWSDVGVRGAARVAALIDAHRGRALRTRDLANVCRNVPDTHATLSSLRYRGAEPTVVETLFDDLGWQRIAERIPRWSKR